jgi:hypothetical protein
MKKFAITTVLSVLTVLVGTALSANAQSVSGSIAGGRVTRGTPARATVYLILPAGLHANSNRPQSEYAIPTVVRARSSKGVKISSVSYPRGQNRRFAFSNEPINVYTGRVPFTFTVTVPDDFKGKTVRVNVSVRYQACTDEECYLQKTKNVTLTARVE